ncbi:MAG: hypothetical protein Q4G26_03295 [Paracoccus sp. (in: a-proteobacteria)]|nr:hypothetical protein [Paracoccus sp. (in: a-proteobacteria)]
MGQAKRIGSDLIGHRVRLAARQRIGRHDQIDQFQHADLRQRIADEPLGRGRAQRDPEAPPMQITQKVGRAGNGAAQARHPFIDGGEDFLFYGAGLGGGGGGEYLRGQFVHAAANAGGNLGVGDLPPVARGDGALGHFPGRFAVDQCAVKVEDGRREAVQCDRLFPVHAPLIRCDPALRSQITDRGEGKAPGCASLVVRPRTRYERRARNKE